jgi:hypothetical protein
MTSRAAALEAFHENYESLAPAEFMNVGQRIHELMLDIFGDEAAEDALNAAMSSFGSTDYRSWREIADDLSLALEAPASQTWHGLYGFAFYGVCNSQHTTDADNRAWAKEQLKTADRTWRRLPEGWREEMPEAKRDLLAAEARWRLISGEGVPLEGLAALAGISRKRIANLLSAQDTSLQVEERVAERDGGGQTPLISNASASAWLAAREDFWPTRLEGEEGTTERAAATIIDEEVVFVPVSKQGSAFLPDSARLSSGGYRIGSKGYEIDVSDYWDALARLQKMAPPRWRTLEGKRGYVLVTGVTWMRCQKSAINEPTEQE